MKKKGSRSADEWRNERSSALAMGMGYLERRNNGSYIMCPGEAAPKRRYLRMGYSIHTIIVWALSELGVSQEKYFRALALDLVDAVNSSRERAGLPKADLDFASIVRKDNLRWATDEMRKSIGERGREPRRKKIRVHENDGVPLALKDYPEKAVSEEGA